MTFFQAINTCFSKYTIFSGRAKRSEYWYWRLFELFLALLAFRLDMIFFSNSDAGSISLFVFFSSSELPSNHAMMQKVYYEYYIWIFHKGAGSD